MNEQLLKTSGADVLSSRKKLRKTLWGGVTSTTPLPLYVQGFKDASLNNHQVTFSFALKRNELNI